MRQFAFLIVAVLVIGLMACDKPVSSAGPVAPVPADPWRAAAVTDPAAELYASCASCHMADGSGRTDGTIPRLAGQRPAVLIHKLEKLQVGAVTLPVMLPYARSLIGEEITAVAQYLAGLPVPEYPVITTAGEGSYRSLCAGCHGSAAEGIDALRSPRLCAQHAPYLVRRMEQIAVNQRGDADPAMAALAGAVSADTRQQIAQWLAQGSCAEPQNP